MHIYILLNKAELINTLSSKMLNLYTCMLYTSMPNYTDTCNYILSTTLDAREKRNLIKLGNSSYQLPNFLDLEIRRFKILVPAQENLKELQRFIIQYKEIKLSKNNSKLFKITPVKGKNFVNLPIEFDELILKNEEYKQSRLNKIKGFIFGLSYNPEIIQGFIFDHYQVYQKEMKQVYDAMHILKDKHMLRRNLYTKFNSLLSELNLLASQYVNNIDKSQILFSYNKKKSINLNKKLYPLPAVELYIFQQIINKLIIALENSKECLGENILAIIKSDIQNITPSLANDIDILTKRIAFSDYTTNISDISHSLFKNLYALYVNFNTPYNLPAYLEKNSIQNNFISYAVDGAIRGFKNTPCSFIINQLEESWSYEFIKSSLSYTEKELCDISLNYMYTRKKLTYYINELSKKIHLLPNAIPENISLEVINNLFFQKINFTHKNLGQMTIKIYPKAPNMGKSIQYFNNKIILANELYPNMKYNDKIYFTYNFTKRSKMKISRIQQEYYFSIFLNNILNKLETS